MTRQGTNEENEKGELGVVDGLSPVEAAATSLHDEFQQDNEGQQNVCDQCHLEWPKEWGKKEPSQREKTLEADLVFLGLSSSRLGLDAVRTESASNLGLNRKYSG